MAAVASLAVDGPLHVRWDDGRTSTFHAVWLRDNCPCPECRHPSGQRLLDSTGIADDLALESARAAGGAVETTFSDGHAAQFDAEWLRTHAYDGARGSEPRPRDRLWDATVDPPAVRYDDVVRGGAALRGWLAALDELGFALLRDGPTAPGTVLRVASLFGFVRETNYGRLFDVRSVVEPRNLAYTGLGLGAHTDNPYRDPTPTLQLLHCLASSARGGESTIVDGFRVAADLRDDYPERFELLARTPLRFRYRDADTELEAEWPVIGVDARGDVAAIRFNTRSAAPLQLDPALVEPWYDAYRAFGRMLASPQYVLEFALEPGDLLVVDNLRVLHGRRGFSDVGSRHLQGCYADRDGLRSRLAVLRR